MSPLTSYVNISLTNRLAIANWKLLVLYFFLVFLQSPLAHMSLASVGFTSRLLLGPCRWTVLGTFIPKIPWLSPYSKFLAVPLWIQDWPNTLSERRSCPHSVCSMASRSLSHRGCPVEILKYGKTSLARTRITQTLGLREFFWPGKKSLFLYRDADR